MCSDFFLRENVKERDHLDDLVVGKGKVSSPATVAQRVPGS